MIHLGYDWMTPRGPLSNGVFGFSIGDQMDLHPMSAIGNGELDIAMECCGLKTSFIKGHVSEMPGRYFYPIEPLGPSWMPFRPDREVLLQDTMSELAKNDLRSGKSKILLWNAYEGHYVGENTARWMDVSLKSMGLDHGSMVIVTSDIGTKKSIEFRNRNNLSSIVPMNFFELKSSNYYRCGLAEMSSIDDALESERDKAYLCLNRRSRWHRPYIVAGLSRDGILSDGYVSFHFEKKTRENMLMSIEIRRPDLVEILKNLESQLPLTVDQPELETNWAYEGETLWPYMKSYFNLTTETLFDDDGVVFFSEKTFKPIAHLQPFLLVATPGSLHELRKLGYCTFHPLIDESYDLEQDHVKRLEMILSETKRLVSLGPDGLRSLYKRLMPVLEHNRSILLEDKSSRGKSLLWTIRNHLEI